MSEKLVGKIIHVYPKISVAVIELEGPLNVGDRIAIKRGEESFEQVVSSIQIEHESVAKASAGQSVGIKTIQPTKEGAKVFKVL
jgi:translation initiation factor IF-2